jgi:radial spoke head protein 9
VTWRELAQPTAEEIETAQRISGLFTGNLAHTYRIVEEVAGQPPRKVALKEERRIAAFVAAVDQDASVVPTGAYILNAAREIVRNRSFEGLSGAALAKLASYVHLRPSVTVARKSLLQRETEGLVPQIDFLDPLSEDKPSGTLYLFPSTNICVRLS